MYLFYTFIQIEQGGYWKKVFANIQLNIYHKFTPVVFPTPLFNFHMHSYEQFLLSRTFRESENVVDIYASIQSGNIALFHCKKVCTTSDSFKPFSGFVKVLVNQLVK